MRSDTGIKGEEKAGAEPEAVDGTRQPDVSDSPPAERAVYTPSLSTAKLDKLLAKPKLDSDDIEALKDYKWLLLNDKQTATDKGFYQGLLADGGEASVLKNKFWLTNIENRIKDSGHDPQDLANNRTAYKVIPVAENAIAKNSETATMTPNKLAGDIADANRNSLSTIPERTGGESSERNFADARRIARGAWQADSSIQDAGTPEPGQTELKGKQKEVYTSNKAKEAAALTQNMEHTGSFPSEGFMVSWERAGKPSGTEHKVSISPDKTIIRKFGNAAINHTWSDYFDRLEKHNSIFPDTAYKFKGFSTINGELHAVVDQPFICGDNIIQAKTTNVDAEMSALGFQPYVRPQYVGKPLEVASMARLWVRPGDMVAVWDVRPANVLQNSDTGTLFFIDPVLEQLPADYDLSKLTPLKIGEDGSVSGSKFKTENGEVVPIEYTVSRSNVSNTTKPQPKITDFGEKLGGARKDFAVTFEGLR